MKKYFHATVFLTGLMVTVLSFISFLHSFQVVRLTQLSDYSPSSLQGRDATYPEKELSNQLHKSLDCPEFLRNVATNINDRTNAEHSIRDPNKKWTMNRALTKTKHPFWVSVHSKEYDSTRYGILERGQYYENYLEKLFEELILESEEKSATGDRPIVLDVGGNIGYYSLLSRSLGASVYAFEPNPVNLLRFCESLILNGWYSPPEMPLSSSTILEGAVQPLVMLYPKGISSEAGRLELFVGSNPGAGTFIHPSERKYNAESASEKPVANIDLITLDDFAQSMGWIGNVPGLITGSESPSLFDHQMRGTKNITILKIDVEGFDSHVLLGGQRLLQSRLVQHVLVEVSGRKKNLTIAGLNVLVHAGYRLKGQGGWMGPRNKSPWQHNKRLATNIANKIESINGYLNLWWTLDES